MDGAYRFGILKKEKLGNLLNSKSISTINTLFRVLAAVCYERSLVLLPSHTRKEHSHSFYFAEKDSAVERLSYLQGLQCPAWSLDENREKLLFWTCTNLPPSYHRRTQLLSEQK